MKMFIDFIPIVLFFVIFKMKDIYWATGVAIAATIIMTAVLYAKNRKVERMQLVSLVLIVVLGGLTLLLHDDRFIMWKPTGVYWAFAIAFIASHYLAGGQPLIKRMLAEKVDLPESLWIRMSWSWIAFFFITGVINLIVAFNCSRDTWVNFKLFGLLGLFLVFGIIQTIFMAKYLPQEGQDPPA